MDICEPDVSTSVAVTPVAGQRRVLFAPTVQACLGKLSAFVLNSQALWYSVTFVYGHMGFNWIAGRVMQCST
jgi:hypothetical protein